MNITQAEIAKLKATKSEQEWNKTCDEIKRARNNQYPPDWWPIMMMSGLAAEIQAQW